MTAIPSRYVIYRTVATADSPVGTVVNMIMWDGITAYAPGTGLAIAADSVGAYPLGSTYPDPATAATTATAATS